MKKALLIGLCGIAATAAAEEWFVPRATHVRIANPGANAVSVDVDGRTMILRPRESYETSGSVRIATHERLDITALHQTDRATATLPVLDTRDALDAGFLPLVRDAAWESTVGILNPHDVEVVVTFGSRSIDMPARAIRHVDASDSAFTATRPVVVYVEDVNVRSGARLITKARPNATSNRRRSVRIGGPVPQPEPQKQTVTLTPSKDATLYEIGSGSLANGVGVNVFSGLTNAGGRRRALVHFDIASQIPAGSKVTSVTLTMQVTMTISGSDSFRLHPVTADWSEGASNAGDSRDGGGTSPRTGDATWIHTSFNTRRWANAGGDFNATPDATTTFLFGPGTWGPSESLTARVQAWVDQPATNFGWIILGNEGQSRSAKRFASREAAGEARPKLLVEFTR